MYLKSIFLANFRNYKKLNVEFENGINIICGKNGQGKTNLLESIYVLGLTKSHQTSIDNSLILKGEEEAKIKGVVVSDYTNKKLEILFLNDKKNYYIDDEKIKQNYLYLSNLNVVLFTPDDLSLIKGSPEGRRKYLDIVIGQLNREYYKLISDYKKILKMRNDYLKKNSYVNRSYLDSLTEHLIDKASYIMYFRNKYICKLNLLINDIYKNIMNLENFYISYKSCVNDFSSIDKVKNELSKIYEDVKEEEIYNRITSFGPHHDDFDFFIAENNLKNYGSQGQQRCAIISLKLAEIKIIKEVKNTPPVLLLDDVFSELDAIKRNNLLNFFNKDMQVIITTTDIDNIDQEIVSKSKIFEIDSASIVNIKEVER